MACLKRLLFLFGLCITLTGCAQKPKEGYIITNVNIIPMNEEVVLENRNIVVKNGKINGITDYSEKIPPNLTKIDGTGKYIIPGLMDMHVFLVKDQLDQDDLLLFLANGVTTIRNIFGTPEHLKLREQLEKGELAGPRLFTSSPIMNSQEIISEKFAVITSPYEVEYMLRDFKQEGYDFITTYTYLHTPVYQKITEYADEIDLPVAAFFSGSMDMETVLRAGPHSIESSLVYNTETVFDIAVKNKIWHTTLLWGREVWHQNIKSQDIKGVEYTPERMIKYWDISKKLSSIVHSRPQATIDMIKRIYNEGGNIVLGTQSNAVPYVIPGFSIHEELRILVDYGFTPFEALKLATVNGARCLGILKKFGTIEIGKTSDFLLLEKNPLEDIRNSETILGVMQGSKWYGKKILNAYLSNTAERIKQVNTEEIEFLLWSN